MKLLNKNRNVIFIFVLLVFGTQVSARAAELLVPSVEVYGGQMAEVPVKIRNTDTLAGVRFIFRYDERLLDYDHVSATPVSENFLQAVNDRKPGLLIIVMAGAEGMKAGENTILKLYFKAASDVDKRIQVSTGIHELELISDQLRQLDVSAEVAPFTILPETGDAVENKN